MRLSKQTLILLQHFYSKELRAVQLLQTKSSLKAMSLYPTYSLSHQNYVKDMIKVMKINEKLLNDLDLNLMDWKTLLELISVDRTIPYAEELLHHAYDILPYKTSQDSELRECIYRVAFNICYSSFYHGNDEYLQQELTALLNKSKVYKMAI